jgi:prepilin-type processing-associated H-X9-DG protein
MSDEDLIGYLFDLLDPEDGARVAARIHADPALATRLEQLRATIAPVLVTAELERETPPEPAPGLAVRAIGRVAQHIVEHEPRQPNPPSGERDLATLLQGMGSDPSDDSDFPPLSSLKAPSSSDGPDSRTVSARFRVDLLVAAGIAFLGLGLIVSGVSKARAHNRMVACQESLRTLHVGLSDYANNDPSKRYPQIASHQTADTFASSLTAVDLPDGYRPGCPAAPTYAPYSYTLCFHGPDGKLQGLTRPTASTPASDEHDLMPIAADFPTASAALGGGPVSAHGNSMNVLFVGGNVRVTTSPHVGPGGDHIYCNVYGQVRAGAHSGDAVLGRPWDQP